MPVTRSMARTVPDEAESTATTGRRGRGTTNESQSSRTGAPPPAPSLPPSPTPSTRRGGRAAPTTSPTPSTSSRGGKGKAAKGKKTRTRAAAGKQPTLFDTSSDEEEVAAFLPPPPPPPPPSQAGSTTTKRKKAKARVVLPSQVRKELPPPLAAPLRKLAPPAPAVAAAKVPVVEEAGNGRALRPRGPDKKATAQQPFFPAELRSVVPGVLASQSRLVGAHLTSAIAEFGSAFDRFETKSNALLTNLLASVENLRLERKSTSEAVNNDKAQSSESEADEPLIETSAIATTTEEESDNNGDIEMPHATTFIVPKKISNLSSVSTIPQKKVSTYSKSKSEDLFEEEEIAADVIPLPKNASASTNQSSSGTSSSTSKSNPKTYQKQGLKRSRAKSTDISNDVSVDMFEDAEDTPTPKPPSKIQFNFLAAAEKESIPVQPTKKFILDSTFVVDKPKNTVRPPFENATFIKEENEPPVDDLNEVFESSVMIIDESEEDQDGPSPRPPTPPKKKNPKKYAQDETYLRPLGLDSKSILECVEEEGDSEDLSPVIMQKPHAAVSTAEEAGGGDKNSSSASSSSSSNSSYKSALTHQTSAPSFSGYNKAATKTLDSIKKKTEDAERNKKENLKRKQELQKKKNEEWKLKAEKIKHMQEQEQQQKITPHPTAVSKPVLATLPATLKPSKAPLPLAAQGVARLMEGVPLPMFKPSGPMKGFLKQHSKVAQPLNTQGPKIDLPAVKPPAFNPAIDVFKSPLNMSSSFLDASHNASGVSNSYDITRYEDLDEELKHRENKPVPAWATNNAELAIGLFKQLGCSDFPGANFPFPKVPLNYRLFPSQPGGKHPPK